MKPRRDVIVPAAPPELGGVNLHVGNLHGKDIAEVAKYTCEVGREIVAHWNELKPIVQQITQHVRRSVEAEGAMAELSPHSAANLLATCASVVDKMAKAGQSMLRAAEGQSRLYVLLMGGVPERPSAKSLSERQLAGVVIEAAKRMRAESGVCPICAPPAGAGVIETTAETI